MLDFKQLQLGLSFLPILFFILAFISARELIDYKARKETQNRFLQRICFSKEPIPTKTAVLIIIDYVFLAMLLAVNLVALVLSGYWACILFLIYNGCFLVFLAVVGSIVNRVKSNEDNF